MPKQHMKGFNIYKQQDVCLTTDETSHDTVRSVSSIPLVLVFSRMKYP